MALIRNLPPRLLAVRHQSHAFTPASQVTLIEYAQMNFRTAARPFVGSYEVTPPGAKNYRPPE